MQNKIDFEEIISQVIENLQTYLDEQGYQLNIQSLTNQQFFQLEHLGILNWSYIITEKYHYDDTFNFGLTLKRQNTLLGAVISAYKLNKKHLEIYGIERFGHSELDGKMLTITLIAAFLLLTLTNGEAVTLVDVEQNDNLSTFYKSYGFKTQKDQNFILYYDDLKTFITQIED